MCTRAREFQDHRSRQSTQRTLRRQPRQWRDGDDHSFSSLSSSHGRTVRRSHRRKIGRVDTFSISRRWSDDLVKEIRISMARFARMVQLRRRDEVYIYRRRLPVVRTYRTSALSKSQITVHYYLVSKRESLPSRRSPTFPKHPSSAKQGSTPTSQLISVKSHDQTR